RITRMDAAGTVTTIAERWHGKRVNKPNDIVCRSDGSIFFMDPEWRLPPAQRELGFSGVFRIDPQGQVHLATNACAYPNGLAFPPMRPSCTWRSVDWTSGASKKQRGARSAP